MVVLRIADGIRSHFPARASEWALAGIMAGWGWTLLRPVETFATSRAYSQMAVMADESTWGWGAITVGLVRLVALVVNGTFANTVYARMSPHVRGLFAFFACFIWLQITLGLIGSREIAPGVWAYGGLFALDAYNAIRTFGEAAQTDRARRNAGAD